MTIRVTKSNESGFPAPPAGDQLGNIADPLELQFYLQSVYEGSAFSVDLTFEGAYADPATGALTYAPATNVTFAAPTSGVTITKLSDSSVRVVGPYANPFPNTFYRFKMADYSTKILSPNTTENWIALVEYNPPSPTFIEKTFDLSVTIPADPTLGGNPTTETVTMHNWVYWTYSSARTTVINLVAQGEK
jgi:hypothetical protein